MPAGRQLHINAEATGGSMIRVGVLDAASAESPRWLDGRSPAECAVVMGNFVDLAVRWGGGATVAEAIGVAQPLRLAFEFSGHARLYSFWFS